MSNAQGDPANVPRLERNDILHRKNVELLSAAEVSALRRAFAEVKQISVKVRSDKRGFFEHAGQHGVPYWLCPHHTPQRLFLPWHRAYLYRLEQALQDRVPGVTLPWWDWTTTRGVPSAYRDAQSAGAENPLFSTRTLATEVDRREGRPLIEETFRGESDPRSLPTGEELSDVLREPNFVLFSDALEEIHDTVHGWTGGTMGNVAYAAFDPLFWAHHCMIDRVWWLWQQNNRINAVPTPGWEEIVLEPFNMRVGDTLVANAMGYEYADTEAALEHRLVGGSVRVVTEPVATAEVVKTEDFARADLEIGGIRDTGSSYEGRVFINNPEASEETSKEDPSYAGSFHVFGHGGCFGAEGHCDVPDQRRLFDFRPLPTAIRSKKRVRVTGALKGAAVAEEKIQFTIVAIPVGGSAPGVEPEGMLDIKRISVVTYR